MKITAQMKAWLKAHCPGVKDGSVDLEKLTETEFAALFVEAIDRGALSATNYARLRQDLPPLTSKVKAKKVIAGAGVKDAWHAGVKVKPTSDRWSKVKRAHCFKGVTQPEKTQDGIDVRAPSEYERAVCGAWWKGRMLRHPLRDEEKSLLMEAAEREQFVEIQGRDMERTAEPWKVKALLDDTVSGGLGSAPIFFSDLIISFPLLQGELAPFVRVVDIPRGRRIESASLQNPTFVWGPSEGMALQPFNTAGLAASFDTPIFVGSCVVECGQDLISDSGVADLGGLLIDRIGNRYRQELDRVIGVGDGVVEPLGLFNATGTTVVNSDNGLGGPPTVSDAESLLYGLGKAYRAPEFGPCFILNDTLWRRFAGIAVGPTDERRIFGTLGTPSVGGSQDRPSYQMFGFPARVSQFAVNSVAAFAALRRYRLYRRLGMTTEWATADVYSLTRTTRTLVCRSRLGGQMEEPGSLCLMVDAQA